MIYKWIIGIIAISFMYTLLNRFLKGKNTPQSFDCPSQHFQLQNMSNCHPWLTCKDFKDLDVGELVGVGAVKAVYRAKWKNSTVAFSQLNNPDYLDDFKHGLNMLQLLNPSPYVVQLIGFCEVENVILTEYHKFGNAVNITHLIHTFGKKDDLQLRLRLCLNYALLLEYLHDGPAGHRVMCDSNSLDKLLSQLLVTDEIMLVLNDLDALPEIIKELNNTIKCGHNKLEGNFIAPEQHWDLPSPFDDDEMPGYDEKIDIWKAATVCDHFIGDVTDNEMARYRLFFLHKSCKNVNAKERPTATQLAAQYMKIMYELHQDDL